MASSLRSSPGWRSVQWRERDMGPSSEFVAAAGELLSIVVWFVFGALMAPVVRDASWHDLVYAIASLTMIRMASVGVALIGGGLDARTVLFIGWFGPRGLASVVFALLAFDALDPADAHAALSAIAVTVVLSVVAHGLSAGPLAVRYGARAKARGVPMDAPPHVAEIPARSFVRRGAHPMPSPPEHRPDG